MPLCSLVGNISSSYKFIIFVAIFSPKEVSCSTNSMVGFSLKIRSSIFINFLDLKYLRTEIKLCLACVQVRDLLLHNLILNLK